MAITWEVIDILVCLIEAILLFKYMKIYFSQKFSYRINLILIFALSISTYILLQFYTTFRFVKVLVYLMIAIFISISHEGNIIKKLLRFLVLLALTIGIENLVVFIMITTTGQSISAFIDNTTYRMTAISMSKVILYIIITWFADKRTTQLLDLKIKRSVIVKITALLIITITIMSLVLNLYTKYKEEDSNMNILSLSFSIFCILAISIYNDTLKQAKEQMELSLINQQKQMQYKFAKSIEESIDEMKYLRHDMSKHMTSIAWYIENKKYDKLEKYISDISLPLEKSSEIIILGNSEVSALLSSKINSAKKNGITFNIKSNFEEKIIINSVDLCILLGNIIDNAIEACLKIDEAERMIDLDIRSKSGYVLIDCTNSLDNKYLITEGTNLLTNKKNRNKHGLGLRIIHRTVEAYEGDIDYHIEDNKFVLKLTVLNKQLE